jgi:hypothetical protein
VIVLQWRWRAGYVNGAGCVQIGIVAVEAAVDGAGAQIAGADADLITAAAIGANLKLQAVIAAQ